LAVAADGVVEIDLVEHGPHALLAGTTGAGKSDLLRP
jgi:S-DNA-T family DNA segregation ATPase FtsK/SpoIIIE